MEARKQLDGVEKPQSIKILNPEQLGKMKRFFLTGSKFEVWSTYSTQISLKRSSSWFIDLFIYTLMSKVLTL